MREIEIGGRKLGDGHPPWVVAEVGINHDGDVQKAIRMVGAAAAAGVDAVKFGVFKADEFCAKSDPLYETFKRCELPPDSWHEIKAECDRHKVTFFATPQNESDLLVLLKVGVPCIKVGSDDLTNLALLEAYAAHGLPVILSTGMADKLDVFRASHSVRSVPHLICVCTSEYPCPPEHANLARITAMRTSYRNRPIGFSDHTVGAMAATVAAALGACYFEKHFTLDNDAVGPDHKFSANPTQLGTWVWAIRNAVTLLGSGNVEPTKAERANRPNWRRTSGQQLRGQECLAA